MAFKHKMEDKYPSFHIPSTEKIVRRGDKPISVGIKKTKNSGWIFYKCFDQKDKGDIFETCLSKEQAKQKLDEYNKEVKNESFRQ